MNEQSRIAHALAMSGPGMSEEGYRGQQAYTLADRYVDIYGDKATRTGRGNYVEASSPFGQ